ncbi:glycogenin-2 [Pteropus vampyrus]|uniref:glycogenin glucosyltransferase n=1 Tax=Pteropus vampyrus TaxID=132908 RepID=A0A6P3RI98_PTEVA|nr:glycogenin-2 [Pteropus vampyrus]
MPVSDQAFVTLATNDVYCQGALVLGQSLRNHRATRMLVVLITPQVSGLLRPLCGRASGVGGLMYSQESSIEGRKDLQKVLSNIDELFDRSELSAAPDPGWPDCFNSGVFVFQPSLDTHRLLLQHASDHGSFDGADQGLLNSFFSSWPTADIRKHLPFTYNLSSNTAYTYSPAFRQFGSSVKVVHFLGSTKPWNYKYNPQTGSVLDGSCGPVPQHEASFLNLWWGVYHGSILPLYGSIRHQDPHVPPGRTAHLSGVGEPCADPAARAEGPGADSVPAVGEPCAKSAAEPGQAWPAADPSEPPVAVAGTPPSPERGHSEEVDLAISVAEISIEEKVVELSSEEQRRTWEEGRIDYMGKDAFARIQEKLDRFLQ